MDQNIKEVEQCRDGFYSKRHMRRKRKMNVDKSFERIKSRFELSKNLLVSSIKENISQQSHEKITVLHDNNSELSARSNDDVHSVNVTKKVDNSITNLSCKSCTENNIVTRKLPANYECGIQHSFIGADKDIVTVENNSNVFFENSINTIENEIISEADLFEEKEFCYRYSDCEDSDCSEDFENIENLLEPDYKRKNSVQNIFNAENNEDLTMSISNELQSVIARWAVKCNIPRISITKLLHNIRDKVPLLSLPLDSRTILQTPRQSELSTIAGGQYCHFGLKECIEKILSKRDLTNTDRSINLIINIDGAPLGKSTTKNLWPILCSEKHTKLVYIIGVYCGESKPSDPNEFLGPFVEEAITLINEGIIFNEIKYDVKIFALVCDAPAKAFVLCTKYHTGYDCCSKCTIEGTMYRSVCFPGKMGSLRTDEEFQEYAYSDDYQKSETILTSIPNFGLVTCVPLDPMHLVYLGCTRKLLLLWLSSKSKQKLPEYKVHEISSRLLSLKNYITNDFVRKPRNLKYIKFFKATEFRQFLLYTGVIAIKNIVSNDVYLNFVTLHIAISILSNPVFCKDILFVDYAQNLLSTFVRHFEKIYGPQHISYNVHNLLHLTADARKYGELEQFSAFRFENFIGRIKQLIRKGDQPLQQLLRRCAEIEIAEDNVINKLNMALVEMKQQHVQGPLTATFYTVKTLQYKVIQLEMCKISCNDNKNNCVLIDNKYIVEAFNFVRCTHNDEVHIIGKRMKILGDLYHCPLPSSEIGINVVCETADDIESWNIRRLTCKLCKLPYQSNYVTFPILHTMQQI